MSDINRLRPATRRGFTLIEVLVVIAIIGILVAVAIPQLSAYRRNAYDSEMVTELRNAATAQEAYFVKNFKYTNTVAGLEAEGFKSNPSVTITTTAVVGPPASFTMTAVHSNCAAGSSRTLTSAGYIIDGSGCQ